MAMRKWIAVVAFVTVLGGALAGSKQTDAEILTRVGRMTAKKVTAVMPDTSALAGPLVALTPPDLMPVADRVRVRIKTDQVMDGATVTVAATSAGEVTLRGEVKSATQRLRAVELAQTTTGVSRVVPELIEPGK
jgi:BON domain